MSKVYSEVLKKTFKSIQEFCEFGNKLMSKSETCIRADFQKYRDADIVLGLKPRKIKGCVPVFSEILKKPFNSINEAAEYGELHLNRNKNTTASVFSKTRNIDVALGLDLTSEYRLMNCGSSKILGISNCTKKELYEEAIKQGKYRFSFATFCRYTKNAYNIDDILIKDGEFQSLFRDENTGETFKTKAAFISYANSIGCGAEGTIAGRLNSGWTPKECLFLEGRGLELRIDVGESINQKIDIIKRYKSRYFKYAVYLCRDKASKEVINLTADLILTYPVGYQIAPDDI